MKMNIFHQVGIYRVEEKRIIIYCVGLYGQLFYELLKTRGIAIDYFLGSDSEKWCLQIVKGVSCISPSEVRKLDCAGFICVKQARYIEVFDNEYYYTDLGWVKHVMKLIIFGAGNTGKNFYSKIVNHKNVYGDTVIAFSDNNSKLWNTYEDTIPIISPMEIANYDYDIIIIASLYEREIFSQLVESNQRDKIMLLNEYERKVYTHYKYLERYGCDAVYSQKACNNKIVVYTSITGNWDELNEPLYVSSDIEYICFTNNRNLKSKFWNVQYIEDNSLDNMFLAKKVKMFPDLFLKEYETSVWVDGKFQIQANIKEYIMKYQRSEPMLCFPHFSRSCIYEEAGTCIAAGIGIKNDIIHQIACYEREGYPIDNGLYEMGCIVRSHNDDMVKRVMSSWWEEVQKYSYRDQISFPVVCWRNDFRPDICDQDIYKNKWLLCKRNYSKIN